MTALFPSSPGAGGPACAAPDVDPEWFWPVSPDPSPADSDWPAVQQALALCAACPAAESCRALLLSQRTDAGGIWFGTTEAQRAQARRRTRQGAAA